MKVNARVRVRSSRRRRDEGYILLTLILFMTLLAIAMLATAPSIAFQVRRDREEELVHRGVQYSRAVQKYFKKFGRYPTRIEELENTNQIRFLRKRYKDPITGKDFKVLHIGEVQLSFGAGIAGATPAGAQPGAAAAPSGATSSPAQASSASGSTPGPSAGSQQSAGDKLSGQVFGGGPIVGVVSTSKDQSIREFNHKDHYNQWQFIYDPSTDRGGLLSTPNQPPLQGAIPVQQVGGAAGSILGQQPTQPAQPPPQSSPPQSPQPQPQPPQ